MISFLFFDINSFFDMYLCSFNMYLLNMYLFRQISRRNQLHQNELTAQSIHEVFCILSSMFYVSFFLFLSENYDEKCLMGDLASKLCCCSFRPCLSQKHLSHRPLVYSIRVTMVLLFSSCRINFLLGYQISIWVVLLSIFLRFTRSFVFH